MKILVVDDEKDMQFLFQQKFRKEIRICQYVFQFAFSAEEALQHIQENGVLDLVLVLSDINMPGMNGLELVRIIKEAHPSLTVILITAFSDTYNYQTAMSYGADDYIVKPIDFSTLKGKIDECLNK